MLPVHVRTDEDCIKWIRDIVTDEEVTFCHFSLFRVLVVEGGALAAGCAGFIGSECNGEEWEGIFSGVQRKHGAQRSLIWSCTSNRWQMLECGQ